MQIHIDLPKLNVAHLTNEHLLSGCGTALVSGIIHSTMFRTSSHSGKMHWLSVPYQVSAINCSPSYVCELHRNKPDSAFVFWQYRAVLPQIFVNTAIDA